MAVKKKAKKAAKKKTVAITMDVATLRVFLEAVDLLSELASAVVLGADDPALRKELQKKSGKKTARKSVKKRR